MRLVDQQVNRNDCGISIIKTLYNFYNISIDRDYIKDEIAIDKKGSHLSDIKSFFEKNKFDVAYNFIDLDNAKEDEQYLNSLTPFVLTVNIKSGLHYIIVKKIKNNKCKVLDPSKPKEYTISVKELQKRAHISKNQIDEVNIIDKIEHLIKIDLKKYNISDVEAFKANDAISLYNKLIYFTYHVENFQYKNYEEERKFLKHVVFSNDFNAITTSLKKIKKEEDKINIYSPLILTVKKGEAAVKENEKVSTNKKNQNVFRRLINELGENKVFWHIYISSALVSALITQLAVFINQILIDVILPAFQINLLIVFSIGVGVFKLFDLIIMQYKQFIAIHLGNLLDKYFITSFDKKMNEFSIRYIQSFNRGDLIERLSDSLRLKSFFLRFFTKIMVDLFVAVFSLIILAFINWQLTLLVFVVVIIYYILFRIITPYLKMYENVRFLEKADLFSKIIEKIDGIQVIKSFSIEKIFSKKVALNVDRLIKVQTKLRYVNLLNTSIVIIVSSVASLLIIIFLARESIESQSVTIGQILTFIVLSTSVFRSLSNILKENLMLQENLVVLKRYFDFSNVEPKNSNDGISKFSIDKLELDKIYFQYADAIHVLNDLNFTINKGDRIQIIGKNGTGKSTFCKVVSMLYKSNKGQYLINEVDSSLYSEKAIKQKVLLSTNEDILFNDTLEFNIKLDQDISTKAIVELAKKIEFYDFITEKEENLDFIINESGNNVSTGQRKKILLMRALLSKAEVIILDEVLSGIDNETRVIIEKVINNYSDKTFIIISHEEIKDITFNKKYEFSNGKLFIK